jgi:hypothetical protein
MLGFVAFPDGMQHWALTPLGIAEWSGETAEPPVDATIRSASDLALLPVAVPETDAACLDPGADPLTACAISAGSTTLGYITTAGGMRAFGFEVGPSGATVSVSLLDLPADYDLYLVDDLAQVVGESVHEGVEAEHIGLDLGAGRYYLYVNSDQGRPFVADLPFRLDLSFAQAR